jgi:hypothetical protein
MSKETITENTNPLDNKRWKHLKQRTNHILMNTKQKKGDLLVVDFSKKELLDKEDGGGKVVLLSARKRKK